MIGLIKKCDTKYNINHNYGRNRIDSYNYLLLEKILTFHNVIILITLAFNKNKNHYYFKIFSEKSSYIDKSYKKFFK